MTDYRKLGLQDAAFDNTMAQNAEYVAPQPQPGLSLLFIAACVVLPLGLFVLAGVILHRHFKG